MNRITIERFEDERGLLCWFGQKSLGFNFKHTTVGTIEPDCKRGGHYHKLIKEKLLCVHGKLLFILDDEEAILYPGDMVDVPKKKVHTLINIGSETAFFVEIKNKELPKEDNDIHVKE